MRRRVPFYAQTAEFSCGPACATMVLAHLDGVRPSRRLEFELWRECNLIGVRGTDPWGLAVPLLARGLRVCLIRDRERFVNKRLVAKRFSKADAELMEWAHRENVRRARRLGLREVPRRPTIPDLERALAAGEVPVALVDMGHVHEEPGIPHWNVVVDVDDEHVTVHDPYLPRGGPRIRVRHRDFLRMQDDVVKHLKAGRATLFIGKPRARRRAA